MPEEQPQPQSPEGTTEAVQAEQQEQHLRTIAVRVDESLHAQLRFIAQLSGGTIADEIRRAIEHRITTAQDDPDLIARAQQVREEIEREAAARSAAIAGFMGTTALTGTPSETPKPRRGARPASE
jgi:predicted DNA-binding protein